jgi:hypothetical protein
VLRRSDGQLLVEERDHPIDALLLPVQGQGGVLLAGELDLDERVPDLGGEGLETRPDGGIGDEAEPEYLAARGGASLDPGQVGGERFRSAARFLPTGNGVEG